MSQLDTVKFINFHKKSHEIKTELKGYRWLLLSLYILEDLEKSVIEIFNDSEFLVLYRMNDSYMWNNKGDILNSIKHLKEWYGDLK